MPRAEAGSTKSVANKLKAAGLGRLRWYCQACEKQMRDENGFKCHVASETHVRKMQVIGEDPRKAINEFSQQFLSDFMRLLRTAHGEKKVHLNHFYQEYINDKHHIHMNATKWNSLTDFGKHLGREGLCRVYDEGEKGLHVSWIDNSPDALRRQEAIRKKERQDRGDEEREQKLIQDQIERANKAKAEQAKANNAAASADEEEQQKSGWEEGKKISLNFTFKKPPTPPADEKDKDKDASSGSDKEKENGEINSNLAKGTSKPAAPFSFSKKAEAPIKPKNVFGSAKRKDPPVELQRKAPMSNMQRIMLEEQAKRRKVF
ncbi:hypothetical protein NA57DRAFT_45386 [Rhizodiscina lignyota]|uniref:C2H2-type domain-containing protein n=1 Tax=Rhizodiscina lignyota TaxID=1504668 RepID=A0A9P4I8D7_9PEZI|nr:hypothetical protein NA57DRAFT_45386 [Rhizodiscina lignyota]